MRTIHMFGVLALLAITGGCMNLDVENINEPDQERALTDPSDVQALLGTGFFRFINGTMKNPAAAHSVAANEISSSWGNYGMQNAGTLPRGAYDNSPTASYTGPNETPWGNLYEGLSNVADGLNAANNGMVFTNDAGDDATERARAYGKLTQGVITGWMASFYDQVVIFDEEVLANIEEASPEPIPWPQALDRAHQYLDEAIAIAESAPAFTFPVGEGAWIHANPLTNEDVIQWAHSFHARLMTSSPRTPAERDAVDWGQVIFHLDRGLQEATGFSGPQDPIFWWHRPTERPDGWVRAAYDLIGPSDIGGNYENWLATPPLDRDPFFIETDDRRITGPEGPEDPGLYVRPASPCNLFPSGRGQYFQSCYFFARFAVRDADYNPEGFDSFNPLFLPLQQEHLRAEAILRDPSLGDIETAIDIINIGRVENGELPPLPYTASEDEIWEVFLYEKALEQAVSMASQNFFDRRGFGTMICGTPTQYPIPGDELEVMLLPNYTFGGSGEGAADPATGCREATEPATNVVMN